MLGKRSAQRGLFEADTRYGEFVGQRTFYGYLASQRDELFRDEDFAALYSRHRGRPSVPPSLLATALVLQTYDGVSDEEAKQRADYDLRWKVALGLEVETRPFAKSTLQEFRAQLILHEKTRAIFQRSLAVAKHRGVWKKGKAPDERQHIKLALDTTYILGRGAVKDTFNLLADGIVQVLRGLAELVTCELLEVAEELDCTRYVSGSSLKGQAEVDWSDPQARQRFLAEVVRDAEQVLEVVRGTRSDLTEDSPEDKALVAAAELLARILAQDIERDEHGPRLKRGVAPDRLISVHDPEMRHGRKSSSHRFNGHKAQVAVDTDSQLITAVEVLAGNAPDAEQALKVVEASEVATGCHVGEVLGDCAYGSGETRAEFAEAGRTLIAKVPDLQNQGYFAKTSFDIDLKGQKCTCPNQQTTDDFRSAQGGGGMFVFATEICAVCPLRAQCTRGQGGRTVQVHPQEALLQQARTFQKSRGFAEFRRRRQVVEHRLARLVQLGIRQARYIGRRKTLFQLCLAAAVANLTLIAARSDAATVDHLWLVLSLLVALCAILSLLVGSTITIPASMTRPTPSLASPTRPATSPFLGRTSSMPGTITITPTQPSNVFTPQGTVQWSIDGTPGPIGATWFFTTTLWGDTDQTVQMWSLLQSSNLGSGSTILLSGGSPAPQAIENLPAQSTNVVVTVQARDSSSVLQAEGAQEAPWDILAGLPAYIAAHASTGAGLTTEQADQLEQASTQTNQILGQDESFEGNTLNTVTAILNAIGGAVTAVFGPVGAQVEMTIGQIFSGHQMTELTEGDLGSACNPDHLTSTLTIGGSAYGLQVQATVVPDWVAYTGELEDYSETVLFLVELSRSGNTVYRHGCHTPTLLIYPLPGVPTFPIGLDLPLDPGDYELNIYPAVGVCVAAQLLGFP